VHSTRLAPIFLQQEILSKNKVGALLNTNANFLGFVVNFNGRSMVVIWLDFADIS
jgi:hypothetical protein